MTPILINAKSMKEDMIQSLREEVLEIKEEIGRVPRLVIVKATDDLACQAYVRNKKRVGQDEVGINVELVEIPYGTAIDEVRQILSDLSFDDGVDGIIMQEPVYSYLNDKKYLLKGIYPSCDADCFRIENIGKLMNGNPYITPCTPQGVIDILKYHSVEIQGKRVTVIGRSVNVGLSLSVMLTQMGAVVTTTHSKTPSLEEDIRNADIVVSCVGRKDLIQPEWMKKGSILLGVGINFIDGKQYTDYDVDRMVNESQCSLVGDRVNTTGTATVLNLIKNTIEICKTRYSIKVECENEKDR